MKKTISWILWVIGVVFCVLAVVGNKTENMILLYVSLVLCFAAFIAGAVLDFFHRKEVNSKLEAVILDAHNKFKSKIPTEMQFSHALELMNDIVFNEENSINIYARDNGYEVEYGYDTDTREFFVILTSLANSIELDSIDNEAILVYHEEETNVSELSKKELSDLILNKLESNDDTKDEIEGSNADYSFTIQAAKWQLWLFIIVTVVAAIGAILIVIFSIINDEPAILAALALPGLFLCISVPGLINWYLEKLTFDGETFKYSNIIKRQSCKVTDISSVRAGLQGNITKVVFIGKDGKELIKINDDGTVLKNEMFYKALAHNRIKFERRL